MDQKKNILAVDDMNQIRSILSFGLKKLGYNVILAENGKEALKYAFGENPLDLIILDINMPEMDGYEVAKQLREADHTKHIPIIFLTAKAQKKDVQKGIEVGGNDYVVKPFRVSDVQRKIEKLLNQKQNQVLYCETEEEATTIDYCSLRQPNKLNNVPQIQRPALNYNRSDKLSEVLDCIRDICLETFYEYVDEKLDAQRAMLTLLMRYKLRSEWFYRDHLLKISQTKGGGEKALALDIYSYLYDQGIDFTIEPSSITGEIDLMAVQNTENPLLLDTKIFDGKGRGKTYIRKGFNQIYTHTQQYNEFFAYLLIYKTTEKDLRFSLRLSGNIPMVIHNHKTIFLITIDLYPHDKPASKRSLIKATEITEQEFIDIIEESKKAKE